MNTEMEERVVSLLESYPENKRKLDVLRYELAHPAQVHEDEQIEAMTFGHGDSAGRPAGYISNKTLFIALNYQEKAARLNTESKREIFSQLMELKREQERLEYYVSLLENRQAEVIRLTYFERFSQEEVAKRLGVVPRTLRRIKKEAIAKLTEWYALAERV